MRTHQIILISIAAVIALGLPPGAAEDSSSLSQTQQSDRAVQANQPNCRRWTNECVNCTRSADDSAPVCSNIGVSCQPKPIRCLEDAPSQNAPRPQ